jgi:cytochrome P450
MLHTISSPKVYNKLQAEIDSAFRSGKITRPVIGDGEAKKLPYLQAVINEGLRIFPPGTGLGSKVVPPGGDSIDGIFLPEGTKVGVCTLGLMRNKEVFGEDVGSFRPERWLDVSEEDANRMDFYKDWAFGYGKYVCLGKRVALIELNKVLFEVSSHFWSRNAEMRLESLLGLAVLEFRLVSGGPHFAN